MMRIGIRGHDLSTDGMDGLLSGLKRTGIDALQLVCYKSFSDIKYIPGSIDIKKATQIRTVLNDNNIDIELIGAYFNPVHSNKDKVKNGLDIFKEYLSLGDAFGCNIVGSETGSYNDDKWTYHPQNRTDEARAIVVNTFTNLCDFAKSHNAFVGIEGAAGHVIYDVLTLKKALGEIGRDNIKIIFDIYNFLDSSNALNYLDILDEGLKSFGDKIHCFHIKDCVIEQGKAPIQCPVGKGDFDFDQILIRIKRSIKDPLLIFEGTTGGDIDYAVDFLRGKWNNL